MNGRNGRKKSSDNRGKLIHFDDEGYFYFKMKNRNDLERHMISSFMINLSSNRKTTSRNFLYYQQIDYAIGDICAAPNPDDEIGRVKIIRDIDYDSTEVLFIDTGRKCVIEKNSLEPLPDKIRQIESLVVICRIPNIKIIDFYRFNVEFQPLINQEFCLKFGEDTILNRIWSPELVDKCLIRSISFNIGKLDARTYLLDENIAQESEDYVYSNCLQEDHTNYMESRNKETIEPVEDKNETSLIYKTKFDCETKSSSSVDYNMIHTKHVYITSFHSPKDFYIQEVTSSMKDKLGKIQKDIDSLVMKYANFTDNVFNKRNVYLTQFTEDNQWYRVRILKYDDKKGFLVQYIDWGNFEYKDSLVDFILLSREMGDEAIFLMDEEGMAQRCQLNQKIRKLFKKESSLRDFFINEFQIPVRRIKLEYKVNERHESIWLVTDVFWHSHNLEDMKRMFEDRDKEKDLTELPDVKEQNKQKNNENRNAIDNTNVEEEHSSHSDYQAGHQKVMDYLINSVNYGKSSDINQIADNPDNHLSNESNTKPLTKKENPNCKLCNCEDLPVSQEYNNRIIEFREHLITHIEDFDEIWIDLDDGQSQEMCRHLMNDISKVEHNRENGVKVGHMYVAKYNEEFYRCHLIDIKAASNELSVQLLDKGSVVSVSFDNMYPITDSLAALPITVKKFQLSNHLQLNASIHNKQSVLSDLKLLENHKCRMIRENADSDVLIDLISSKTISFDQILAQQYFINSDCFLNNWSRSLMQALMMARVFTQNLSPSTQSSTQHLMTDKTIDSQNHVANPSIPENSTTFTHATPQKSQGNISSTSSLSHAKSLGGANRNNGHIFRNKKNHENGAANHNPVFRMPQKTSSVPVFPVVNY